MERFASGWKRNYYGKDDVIVYRVRRDGTAANQSPVFGASIKMLVYGDAFWPTYTTGDNSCLIATDSMKNFIQREALNYTGPDLEDCCRFLGAKFLETYPQADGVQVSAVQIPYSSVGEGGIGFAPAGPDRAGARVELNRAGIVEAVSALYGIRLLRLGGSSFRGFVRDEYTTLPDVEDRPLHMWLDLEWLYTEPSAAFNSGAAVAAVRRTVHDVFCALESGSIQQVLYQIGAKILSGISEIAEVHLEANNRTWDTAAERGETCVFTDSRPPYGCLGLRLRR